MLKVQFLIIGLAMFSFSCSKTNSDNVKTSAFYVTYAVVGNNVNSVNCTAKFQVGGATGTFLDLSAGDNVTCDGQAMSRTEVLGIITYSTTVGYVPGKTYFIVFNRTAESPYTSSAVLPETIVGNSPATNLVIQKGMPINLSWTASANPADNMFISLSYSTANGSYGYNVSDSAPEQGTGFSFTGSQTQQSPAVAGSWTGNLVFSRSRLGTVSPGLSGSISSNQTIQLGLTLAD